MTVTLRPFSESDCGFILENWSGTGRIIGQNFPKERDELLRLLAEWDTKTYNSTYFEMFAIVANGALVGNISLYDKGGGRASFGIAVDALCHRRGIAYAAVSQLLGYAVSLGYKFIVSSARADNTASVKLHEKCGFANLGKFKNAKGNEVYKFEISLPIHKQA
jgi:RimJ/RimL family protein N-acetyltransferase